MGLNVKSKTINPLKENIEHLQDLEPGRILKCDAKNTVYKIINQTSTKLKPSHYERPVEGMKRRAADWEKMLQTTKVLDLENKELSKLISNKNKTFRKNG